MIDEVITLFLMHPTAATLFILFAAFAASIIYLLSLELVACLVRYAKGQRGARLYRGYDVQREAEAVARRASRDKESRGLIDG